MVINPDRWRCQRRHMWSVRAFPAIASRFLSNLRGDDPPPTRRGRRSPPPSSHHGLVLNFERAAASEGRPRKRSCERAERLPPLLLKRGERPRRATARCGDLPIAMIGRSVNYLGLKLGSWRASFFFEATTGSKFEIPRGCFTSSWMASKFEGCGV